ncbi:MAG: hypothetical protein ACOY3P_01315 [Planctomycetota bacterium]
MKKFVFAILLLVIGVGFVGCESQTAAPPTDDSAASGDTGSTDGGETTPPAGEGGAN